MSKINPDNHPIYQELVDTLFALNCAILVTERVGETNLTVRYAISDDGLTLYRIHNKNGQPEKVEFMFKAPMEMMLNAVQALHKNFS